MSQYGIWSRYVASIDNQWAIVQSVFFADPEARSYVGARTWGQVVTGPFQDAIAAALAKHFTWQERRGGE